MVGRFLLVMSAALSVGLGMSWGQHVLSQNREVVPREITDRGPMRVRELSTIEIFEEARESVVFISTVATVRDPFSMYAMERPRGTGTGFVWDQDGHVVTNYHVIEGANSAQVRMADGSAFDADLVGVNPSNDLAVLRIRTNSDLRPIPVGSSADLKIGQDVLAIGNPFGLDWTLTTGIISALERELPIEGGRSIRGLVQTDAAINPGNSGGPLIDSAGRLIGVNTAIFSPSGSNAGIGFAVPVDTVNRVVPQLIGTGRYAPPVLGISIDPRTDLMLARAGLAGVMVLGVQPGSGAASAGMRAAEVARNGQIIPGDIITAINGESVSTVGDLQSILDQMVAGQAVDVQLWANGGERTVSVVLSPGE